VGAKGKQKKTPKRGRRLESRQKKKRENVNGWGTQNGLGKNGPVGEKIIKRRGGDGKETKKFLEWENGNGMQNGPRPGKGEPVWVWKKNHEETVNPLWVGCGGAVEAGFLGSEKRRGERGVR